VDAAGRNQIAVAPGANHRLTPDLVQGRAETLAWADVVLLQLETPLDTVRWALEEARRLGKITILNPAPARVLPLPAGLLSLVDYLTPNETEVGLLASRAVQGIAAAVDAARALVGAGVGAVAVTVGGEGCVLVTGAGSIHVPAFRISPVDTVGAGDAFNGALAVLLAAGAPIDAALGVANAAAGLACTRRGAIEALPSRAEVEALMRAERRWPAVRW
jgi:ribokinase